jgi:hypothetical protein
VYRLLPFFLALMLRMLALYEVSKAASVLPPDPPASASTAETEGGPHLDPNGKP